MSVPKVLHSYVAPGKNQRKAYDLHSLNLRSVFYTVLVCFFDKLQPIIAQFDLVLFAS